jgi:hypothetical protein
VLLIRRRALVLVLAAALPGSGGGAPGGLVLEHDPPACWVAEQPPRLVACARPRSEAARLRVLFRAEGGPHWYAAAMRSDLPCFSAVLPRPGRGTAAVRYLVEADSTAGAQTRTREFVATVVGEAAQCPGRVASAAKQVKPVWEAPAGAPRVPPGFEGARAPQAASPGPAVASQASPAPPAPAAAAPRAAAPAPPPPMRPVSPPPTTPAAAREGGGSGARTFGLLAAGAGAAAGGAVLATRGEGGGDSATAPSGSGLPPGGVSGRYVGTETLTYAGGCVGTDDVVLNLQDAGGRLEGVLSFTVRTCACCAAGRGANPVSGSLAGVAVQLATPVGFSYSGSFAGSRLAGQVAGPDGVTGTFTVEKR